MNDRAARQPAVDIVKLIAAVLVITIHTDPLLDLSASANFVLVHIIARVAVPFFIVCTGFFLGKRLHDVGGPRSAVSEDRAVILKSAAKFFKLYLLCSLLYLPINIQRWISTGWFSANAFVDWGLSFFLTDSYVHLWYLMELCYALLVLALIRPLLKKPIVCGLMVVLWIIEVLDYAYVSVLPAGMQRVFGLLAPLSMPFESVVRALPLLLLGMVIARQKPWKWWANVLGLALSLVCLVLEVYGVRSLGGERVSYVFSTLPVAGFLFSTVPLTRPRPAVEKHPLSCQRQHIRLSGASGVHLAA